MTPPTPEEVKTPRTDKRIDEIFGHGYTNTVETFQKFTRQLERELATTQAQLAEAQSELGQVDATLGNVAAFDDCKTRSEKISKAMATAKTADTLRADLDAMKQRAERAEGDLNHVNQMWDDRLSRFTDYEGDEAPWLVMEREFESLTAQLAEREKEVERLKDRVLAGGNADDCPFCKLMTNAGGHSQDVPMCPLCDMESQLETLTEINVEKTKEIDQLRWWKESSTKATSRLDAHLIARMLGAKINDSVYETINRRVPEVLTELEEAKEDVNLHKQVFDKYVQQTKAELAQLRAQRGSGRLTGEQIQQAVSSTVPEHKIYPHAFNVIAGKLNAHLTPAWTATSERKPPPVKKPDPKITNRQAVDPYGE